MTGRIAVTPRALSQGGHFALAALEAAGYEVLFPAPGRQPTRDEQLRFLPTCVGYLAGVEPIGREVLSAARGLKVISRNGVGTDAIDLDAAAEFGIAVETAAGANAQGVAELAVTLMLAGLRQVPAQDAALKAGRWQRLEGREVAGRTLGVIGCGRIGRQVARLGLGLGMSVRAFDAVPDPSFAPAGDFSFTSLANLLAQADVVTLHCPPTARPLIDKEALTAMKPGAYLVNTARSALVDDDAVQDALNDGTLAGYATDVFDQEPPGPRELHRHPRMIMTPHIGGYTKESVVRATRAAVENLLRVLSARP
ncbi:phosphoglycerate dehydrogenase [Streptomyces sp. NPDC004065]|uniref:phosphoglycerate dehydrogenase n=1 Tax=Streptomyces sp. NPDC004065 TaxID=3364689 RepID=UPI00384D5711